MEIQAFYDPRTSTLTYVVYDEQTRDAVVIDPVLDIEKRTRREVSYGAVYTTLGRLRRKGFVSRELGEPTPERGGRAKQYFQVEPAGRAALRSTVDSLSVMWEGVSI